MTVGLFDIGKARSKEFLDRVEMRLHEKNIKTIRTGKPTNAKIATPEILQEVADESRCRADRLSD